MVCFCMAHQNWLILRKTNCHKLTPLPFEQNCPEKNGGYKGLSIIMNLQICSKLELGCPWHELLVWRLSTATLHNSIYIMTMCSVEEKHQCLNDQVWVSLKLKVGYTGIPSKWPFYWGWIIPMLWNWWRLYFRTNPSKSLGKLAHLIAKQDMIFPWFSHMSFPTIPPMSFAWFCHDFIRAIDFTRATTEIRHSTSRGPSRPNFFEVCRLVRWRRWTLEAPPWEHHLHMEKSMELSSSSANLYNIMGL